MIYYVYNLKFYLKLDILYLKLDIFLYLKGRSQNSVISLQKLSCHSAILQGHSYGKSITFKHNVYNCTPPKGFMSS